MTATADTAIPDLRELADASASLEHAPASAAVAWAWEQFGTDMVLAASFQDCVLIDVALQVAYDIEVVFLDTQYHFAETLWYVEEIRKRYDLNLKVMRPEIPPDNRWQDDPDSCCNLRKVQPLERALEGKAAWMTGLRRDEASTRAKAPIISYDIARGIVKVNPLATWSEQDVEGYIHDRALPVHPLAYRGFKSLGCWPCSRPVGDGEHERAGRWAGSDKIECGLHG